MIILVKPDLDFSLQSLEFHQPYHVPNPFGYRHHQERTRKQTNSIRMYL
ncbi:Protein of unknown function [Pyronema omphalodes CBS 100304]|uniref:Uncharacterized protein n=1 Tax=Pyronema omphalodes (strain CBS 100304) TaxID=1076935 RepID=U4LVB0_PYROM|nr:Protein of unknown function [Pyronema omphalodes CBS 100304]